MRKKLLVFGAVASVLRLGGLSIANAVSSLSIADGSSADTVTIVDQSGADMNSSLGEVEWAGTIGSWTLNLEDTGETKPHLGSVTVPNMSSSFQAKSLGKGTDQMAITWSDTRFSPSSGGFNASIGVTTSGSGISIGFTTYYSIGDIIPANTSLPTTTTGTTLNNAGRSFGASNRAYFEPLGPDYSLTEVVTNTASVASFLTIGNATVIAVPDAGSTLILLGTTRSLLGVFGLSRSKWQKA